MSKYSVFPSSLGWESNPQLPAYESKTLALSNSSSPESPVCVVVVVNVCHTHRVTECAIALWGAFSTLSENRKEACFNNDMMVLRVLRYKSAQADCTRMCTWHRAL